MAFHCKRFHENPLMLKSSLLLYLFSCWLINSTECSLEFTFDVMTDSHINHDNITNVYMKKKLCRGSDSTFINRAKRELLQHMNTLSSSLLLFLLPNWEAKNKTVSSGWKKTASLRIFSSPIFYYSKQFSSSSRENGKFKYFHYTNFRCQ